MALSLQEIRDYVRLHLDLEEDDLPDQVLDVFIRDGSKRIERAEPRWPYFETAVELAQSASTVAKNTISADLDQITAIRYSDSSAWPPLVWIGHDAFSDQQASRPSATGRPLYFSEWGGIVYFFPAPDVAYNIEVQGYRKATDWVAAGAGAEPDLPDELHNTVATWALARAYLQQEDPELGAVYERQFSDELNEFRRRLVITPHNQPLVLNGGAAPSPVQRLVRPRFDWEVS